MVENGGSSYILIVEDELVIAGILADYLKQSGFRTKHVDNGIDAVDAVKKRSTRSGPIRCNAARKGWTGSLP
jgi:CheY-like chemotaxis protein